MCAALLVHTMYGLVPRASITLSMPPHLGSLLFPAASFRKLIKNITSGPSDFAKPKKRTEKQCIIFFSFSTLAAITNRQLWLFYMKK